MTDMGMDRLYLWMWPGKSPGTGKANMTDNNEFEEFEIIPEDEIERTPRGRKSNADPKLVATLRQMKKGQAVRINTMRQDPKDPKYGTNKAKISAQIRSAMKLANHSEFSIIFTTDGVPQVLVR